jgi:hypothetical protein
LFVKNSIRGGEYIRLGSRKSASGFNPAEIQRAVPGRLRSLLRGPPEPVLLDGAGASISSGIPAAGEAVERIAKWRWCLDNDRLPNDHSVRRADYWSWLTGQPWFSADVQLAELYPDAVKHLLNVANGRRVFFEDMIRRYIRIGDIKASPISCTRVGLPPFSPQISTNASKMHEFWSHARIISWR